MHQSLLFSILSFLFALQTHGQIPRGSLVLNPHTDSVKTFVSKMKVDIVKVREMGDFLTNRDYSQYLGNPVKKRKKAFMRHIKHLMEELEWKHDNAALIDNRSYEILYELCLFQASLRQAAISDNTVRGTFKEKVSFYRSTKRSKRLFQYQIPEVEHNIENPIENAFWTAPKDTLRLHKEFGRLAKLKKIKAKKKMVVIFDGLSYSGSAPKVKALDLDLDNKWSLKWGDEVHTDVLGSRIFAALGYDVDHPYFYPKDKLTLIFDGQETVKNAEQMIDSVYANFDIDIAPFLSSSGTVTESMASENKKLAPFIGYNYARFKKCAIEGRPDRVKRIGSFVPNEMNNEQRRSLRGAVLAHAFIGNWDTREENTCLTTVHNGNHEYKISAMFSDLGTSLGVKMSTAPADFKVGLVNELPWEVATIKNGKVKIDNQVNSILRPYEEATYDDLKWMASLIMKIDEKALKYMVKKAGWPKPISELYYNKMASRRASIGKAFNLTDHHPISFDRELTIKSGDVFIVKKGKLVVDYQRSENPESFLSKKGRTRNYGH